jgi:cytochrome c1
MYRRNLSETGVPLGKRYQVDGAPLDDALAGINPRVRAYIDSVGHGREDLRQTSAQKIDDFLANNPDHALAPDMRKAKDILGRAEEARLGKTYEVELNADPNHFLDYDKRFGEQSPEVVKKLQELQGQRFNPYDKVQKYAINDPATTREFADAGIPGIKYLDNGSRGAGDGTRNYVAFSDEIVNIVRKYGIAGLAALPPAVLIANGIDPKSLQGAN